MVITRVHLGSAIVFNKGFASRCGPYSNPCSTLVIQSLKDTSNIKLSKIFSIRNSQATSTNPLFFLLPFFVASSSSHTASSM